MFPFVEAKGSPDSSFTGNASMSPRSSTTGRSPSPGAVPRSTATTLLSDLPSVISNGSPSRAFRILAWVRGRWRPTSGIWWSSRRRATRSVFNWLQYSRMLTGPKSSTIPRIAGNCPYRDSPPPNATQMLWET